MTQLRQEYEQFTAKDVEVIVVGPDSEKDFKRVWEKEKIPYIGLPDPQHTVLDLFGQDVKILKLGRMPAQVIIDKQGIVRFAHYGNSMQDIPANDAMLDLFENLS